MKRYDIYPFYDTTTAEEEPEGEWVKYVDVADLQHQLAEVTRERDIMRKQLELADALLNRERGLSPLLRRQA